MKISLPHYLFPVFCILLGLICQYSGLDIQLEKVFYDPQHHVWPYKSGWLTQKVFHDGAHYVIAVLFIAIFMFFISTLFSENLKTYRRTTGFVLLSSLTGVLTVTLLKDTTHLYTPWDLQVFGGQYPNIRLFDSVSSDLPVGHAFPAGHASGGFALMSLYFAGRYNNHQYQQAFLLVALAIGFLLGIDQQIRGAHMLSHDLFTLSICWLACLFWARVLFPAGRESYRLQAS